MDSGVGMRAEVLDIPFTWSDIFAEKGRETD
jgi:hypothetical protein